MCTPVSFNFSLHYFVASLLAFLFKQTGKISADSFQKSFFKWEAARNDLDQILKKDPPRCQAPPLEMLAVPVGKTAARHDKICTMYVICISKS